MLGQEAQQMYTSVSINNNGGCLLFDVGFIKAITKQSIRNYRQSLYLNHQSLQQLLTVTDTITNTAKVQF